MQRLGVAPPTARASTSTRCRRRSTASPRDYGGSRRRSASKTMSELDQLYREVILDHYKNPRGHGVIEDAHAHAEGQNPLCGDEVSIFVRFADDGETIEEIGFEGRGCAISQAATSMLTELVQGPQGRRRRRARRRTSCSRRSASRSRRSGSSARSSASVCSRSRCTGRRGRRSRPSGRASPTSSSSTSRLPAIDVAPARRVRARLDRRSSRSGGRRSASTTAAARSTRSRTAARTTTARSARATGRRIAAGSICPRHGSAFDLATGRPLSLPAIEPVATYPVRVEDGTIVLELPD